MSYAERAWRGCTGWPSPRRVAGNPADRHVDPEAGRGAVFLRLAAPESVLAVLTGPVAAVDQRGARTAHGAGLGLARVAGLGTLARGCEEKPRFAAAFSVLGPPERSGEDEVRDGFGCHDHPLSATRGPAREPTGGSRLHELVAVPA